MDEYGTSIVRVQGGYALRLFDANGKLIQQIKVDKFIAVYSISYSDSKLLVAYPYTPGRHTMYSLKCLKPVPV